MADSTVPPSNGLYCSYTRIKEPIQNPIVAVHNTPNSPLNSIRRSPYEAQHISGSGYIGRKNQSQAEKKAFCRRQLSETPPAMEKEREQLVYLARLAEQAERYDGAILNHFSPAFCRTCTSLNLLFVWIRSAVLLAGQFVGLGFSLCFGTYRWTYNLCFMFLMLRTRLVLELYFIKILEYHSLIEECAVNRLHLCRT